MSIERVAQLARQDPDLFTTQVEMKASVLEWLAVHGQILLAFRHPQNAGAKRDYAMPVLGALTSMLVECGVLDGADLERIATEDGIKFTDTREQPLVIPGVLSCRHCGCTEEHACPGGCSWASIGDDGFGTCSKCVAE